MISNEQVELELDWAAINAKLAILQPIRATNYKEIDELVIARYWVQKRYYQLRML